MAYPLNGEATPYKSIDEIRLMNLRRICEVHGVAKVCARVKVKQPQLIQYVGPKPSRNIGKDFARRVEAALGYAEHWLDHVHHDQPSRLHAILEYAKNLQTLHPEKFDEFARKVERHILGFECAIADSDVETPLTSQQNTGSDPGDEDSIHGASPQLNTN